MSPRFERRHLFALPQLALAAALVYVGGTTADVAAFLLVLDFLAQLPRWPVPRRHRSGRSYWAETLAAFGPLTVFLPYALVAGAPWATALPHVAWFAVAPPVAFLLVWLSRVDLAAIASGDLAYLAGADKPAHATARTSAALAGPVGEEAVFRGVGIGLPSPSPALVVISIVAFITRHHVVRGVRRDARALVVEVTGALAFTALAVASGSIYPSLVAHVLNNAPSAILDAQIARLSW